MVDEVWIAHIRPQRSTDSGAVPHPNGHAAAWLRSKAFSGRALATGVWVQDGRLVPPSLLNLCSWCSDAQRTGRYHVDARGGAGGAGL
jgi:hypothetical protein